jgi:hypothetical protein
MNFARRTKCFKCANPRPEETAPYPYPQMSLPELVIEDEPEAKPAAKVLTERAKVEEEMKRWEKEQQKVEKLNKQLMSFEVGIS